MSIREKVTKDILSNAMRSGTGSSGHAVNTSL